MCECMSAHVHACIYTVHIFKYVCACVSLCTHACPFLCWLTLFTAVVTALWSVSPAGGPRCAGWVCGSGVIMVSPGSWVLRFEKRESERGIHSSIRASIHIPPSKPQTRSRESRKGEKGEEGKVERERHRKRGRPYDHAGNVRVTSVRVYRHCEGPWPAYILLARPRAPLPISTVSRQSMMRL